MTTALPALTVGTCIDRSGSNARDLKQKTLAKAASPQSAGVSSFPGDSSTVEQHVISSGVAAQMGCSSPPPWTMRSTPQGAAHGVMTREKAGSIPAGRTKLYAVVRSDMSKGAKACQAAHALRSFADSYPFIEGAWWRESNTLVLLEAPLPILLELEQRALMEGITCVRFVEPDWAPEGTLTALALGPDAKRLVAALDLAFTEG